MAAVDITTFLSSLSAMTFVIVGAMIGLGKLLWNTSSKWSQVGNELQELNQEIKDLVILKEKDHARIEKENESLKRRIERHEMWHARHDKGQK